jgi:hypothetical protein
MKIQAVKNPRIAPFPKNMKSLTMERAKRDIKFVIATGHSDLNNPYYKLIEYFTKGDK